MNFLAKKGPERAVQSVKGAGQLIEEGKKGKWYKFISHPFLTHLIFKIFKFTIRFVGPTFSPTNLMVNLKLGCIKMVRRWKNIYKWDTRNPNVDYGSHYPNMFDPIRATHQVKLRELCKLSLFSWQEIHRLNRSKEQPSMEKFYRIKWNST